MEGCHLMHFIECNLGKKLKTHPPRHPKNTFPKVFHIKLFVFDIKWIKWS